MKVLAIIIAVGVLVFVGTSVFAEQGEKVFVCKYVGTPNVDERLQTGQNPISVSSNSIQDYQGVGSYFNDAQGRSLVIAVDNGQDEPDCPVPENEEPEEEPEKPPVKEEPTPEVVAPTTFRSLK